MPGSPSPAGIVGPGLLSWADRTGAGQEGSAAPPVRRRDARRHLPVESTAAPHHASAPPGARHGGDHPARIRAGTTVPGGDGDAELDPADSAHLGVRLSSPRSGLTVLTVRGEVDTLTAPRLQTALDELLDLPPDGDGRDLAVDLEGVTFLASSGLGVLIHTARRAARDGRRLFVVATNRAVLRPLEVTGSAQLFTVLPDQEGIPGA